MNKCNTCQCKPGEYICIRPECVQIKDNRMVCYQCYWIKHKEHEPHRIQEVCQLTTEKCQRQIQFLEMIISKNQEESIQLDNFLENQKQIYNTWNDQQKKQIKVLIENENQKLQQKIKEAQQVLKLQNLDQMLNYCTISVDVQEQNYEKASQQSNFERQFQINEIETRINFIKGLNFSISELSNIFVDIPQVSIPRAQEKAQIQYKQCQTHYKPQKYLCIHKDCVIQKSNFPFYCEYCFINSHSKHDFMTYAKKYKAIKQEQDEKTQLITVEQEKLKQCMQQEFNKYYEAVQQQLKEKMNKYEKIKCNILSIKDRSIEQLKRLINFKFIENNINVSLLGKTIQGIKQEYQIEYKSFRQKMSIDLEREAREISSNCLKIDQQSEKEQVNINQLHYELQTKNEEVNNLNSKLKLNQKFISQNQNQLISLKNYYDGFKQKIEDLTKNVKERLNSSIYICNIEKQFLRAFDTDFKSIQTQIIQTETIMEGIINSYGQVYNNQGEQKQNALQIKQVQTLQSQQGQQQTQEMRSICYNIASNKQIIQTTQVSSVTMTRKVSQSIITPQLNGQHLMLQHNKR
ncbi:unnamed protein product [Paramecium octaurelia]|uniref:Uncharacterized protein n=1 Tax=Paramecium octaurelia TaxID=43137 RepID=A0A8S1Y0W5_PAROT|nr:unnamed protein product [Paramecium octaurelia]